MVKENIYQILTMTYEKLISTMTTIINNETIEKEGLIIVYELNEKRHRQMNEELFYKSNPITTDFKPADEFEVDFEDVKVKFIKKVIQ
jgi:hypothetical protein